ncbi:MAG: winged helix-turn-helix transcriptional regulator [Chloroflexi bacterium]|nr:winged helix-turn-helix transcriptional regulator [Chloroflexota bacterium]
MLEQIPNGEPEDLVMLCACFNIRMIARLITAQYTEALAPSNLTPTQFSTLLALQTGGEMPITQLTAILVTDRTTLARNLKPLERDGLVEVTPGEHDKRVRQVAISAAGRQALATALPHWKQAQKDLQELAGEELWVALHRVAHRLHP